MPKKTYQYYQPNRKDLKDKVGDCQVRALSKVLGLTWLQTFDLTIPICRELQTYTIFDCDLNKTKTAMSKFGFVYTGVSNKKGSKRPTVKSFALSHPKGKYILSVAHHAVAVIDGVYYDTWDCGYKSLYGWYELDETKSRECIEEYTRQYNITLEKEEKDEENEDDE